jgi:two-component system sensor kinase FixL
MWSNPPTAEPTAARRGVPAVAIAFTAVTCLAAVDAAGGRNLVILGTLTVGPAIAAGAGRPRAVLVVGGYALAVINVMCWWPDRIWGSARHVLFSVVVVATTAIGVMIAARIRALDRSAVSAETHWRALAGVVAHSDDAIAAIDMNGRLTAFNTGAERLYGYPSAEVIGMATSQFSALGTPPDAPGPSASAVAARIFAGEQGIRFETVRVHRDGTVKDVSIVVSPVYDERGEVAGVSSVTRDISERKKADQVLADGAARITAIVETAVDGILSIDEHGVIDTVNGAVERLFGYSAAELVGQNVSMLMPSPTHEGHDGYLDSYLDTGRKRVIGIGREVVGRRKDGTNIDLDVSVNEMQVGGRRMFTGILRDISERKKIEQALAGRAAALARSNAELQQFAYVASHDLQEPLRKISSYVEILSTDYAEHFDDQAREYIGFAVDGAHRMRRMIVDLLAVSRLRLDAMTVESCDTGRLVGAILEDYALAITDAGAIVVVADLPVVQGDQAHLRQVFQNLISNAVKYRGTETLTLHISAQRHEEEWLFVVADNGIGFKQEYAEKAFGMFQRLVGRRDYEGTGMGLAIVAKVVENHGGKVWAESQPGVGTSFFFTVPTSMTESLVLALQE